MNPDGSAGAELSARRASARSASPGPSSSSATWATRRRPAGPSPGDGVLYTGDLGAYDARGLKLSGRSGLAIKPKGFQVFPGDVENHVLARLDGAAAAAGCVGAEHAVWVEAVVLFVECAPGRTLTAAQVMEASDGHRLLRPAVPRRAPGARRAARSEPGGQDRLPGAARAGPGGRGRLRAEGGWDARG